MNKKHVEILKKGVKEWNKWWHKPPQKGLVTWGEGEKKPRELWVDLSNADLSGMDLSGYIFENACMEGTILRNCNLLGVNMICAYCVGTDFSGAIMRDTNISGAMLEKAVFTKADLRNNKSYLFTDGKDLNLNGALLDGAMFSFIKTEGSIDGDEDEFMVKIIEPKKGADGLLLEIKIEFPATVKEVKSDITK